MADYRHGRSLLNQVTRDHTVEAQRNNTLEDQVATLLRPKFNLISKTPDSPRRGVFFFVSCLVVCAYCDEFCFLVYPPVCYYYCVQFWHASQTLSDVSDGRPRFLAAIYVRKEGAK